MDSAFSIMFRKLPLFRVIYGFSHIFMMLHSYISPSRIVTVQWIITI